LLKLNIDSKNVLEKIEVITSEINNKKGTDIVTINLKKIDNSPCDFFIICTGNSNRQIQSIAKSVEKKVFEKLKTKPWQKEGKNSDWILIDYVDAVIHIFKKEAREFYDLQGLWNDGIIKKIKSEKK